FRFAVLKSLHIPGLPAGETLTDEVPAAFRPDLRSSAAATIAVGVPFAPAVTMAVWPSGEILAPGRGLCTEATRLSEERSRSTRASVCRNAGEEVVAVEEGTTTGSARLERPAKVRRISVRACTQPELFACQPAPESTVSPFGANAASATATIAHARATARTWSAAKRPSLPIGPKVQRRLSAAAGRAGRASVDVVIFSTPFGH